MPVGYQIEGKAHQNNTNIIHGTNFSRHGKGEGKEYKGEYGPSNGDDVGDISQWSQPKGTVMDIIPALDE